MRNLKVILSYDGTEFSGWQLQPDAHTVQGTLASAIGRITGEKVLPQGSGRTDAGVHALAQVMTFVTESSIPAENFLKAMNDILPPSVRVLEVTEAPADFHARHSARAKTYRYRIYREAICPPFLTRYVWHYPYPLEEGNGTSCCAAGYRRARLHFVCGGGSGARTGDRVPSTSLSRKSPLPRAKNAREMGHAVIFISFGGPEDHGHSLHAPTRSHTIFAASIVRNIF